jgi:hypothetical protein
MGVRLVTNWAATGKSRLHGHVGYLTRRYSGATRPTYSGIAGHLDWDWPLTGKTLINLAIYRDLNNSELTGTGSYQKVTGIRALAQWQLRPKLTLATTLGYEINAYGGTTLDESIDSLGMQASYSPTTWGNLSFSAQRQRRVSNDSLRQFDATVLTLKGMLRF